MRISIMLAAVTTGLLLLLGGAGVVAAEDGLRGHGELDKKDTAAGTIAIGEVEYRVTDSTVIRDIEGRKISLAEVPIPDVGRSSGRDRNHDLRPVVTARFDAVEVRGELMLRVLELTESPY